MRNQKREPRRVLFVLGSMEVGGVQSGIMNFARIIPPCKVKFDVLLQSSSVGFHEAAFEKYGNIYHLPLLTSKSKIASLLFTLPNDWVWKHKLRAFLKQHPGYDAIHSKTLTTVATTMEVAKKQGIPVRISQCHVDKPEHLNPFMRWYYRKCAKRIEKNATHKLAVSPGAVKLMFDKFGGKIIKNPTISLERLDPSKFSPTPHKGIRFIQIGTYSHRKNQVFSVEILSELISMGIDAQLTFIGFSLDEPSYLLEVDQKIKKLKLETQVSFLSKDTDVPTELSEADYMLIPSLREGLPNVALEAQAMGVPCFISDTVNRETDCGLCTFLSLEDGPKAWAEQILSYRKEHGTEKRYVDMSAWDNKNVVKGYLKIWNGEEG